MCRQRGVRAIPRCKASLVVSAVVDPPAVNATHVKAFDPHPALDLIGSDALNLVADQL